MNPRHLIVVTAVLLFALLTLACGDNEDTSGGNGNGTDGAVEETFGFGLAPETIASGGDADFVSAIAFAPDGRMFYGEQFEGTIRVVNADGTLQSEPFTVLEDIADWLAQESQDWGLTGLTLDPEFETNHYVYAFYTRYLRTVTVENADGSTNEHDVGQPVIVRFTEEGGTAVETETTIITEDFPESDEEKPGYNLNGEIHFGPDGLLYASLGDYDLFEKAPGVIQNPGSPVGSFLRINKGDGSVAEGNPLIGDEQADARIFAWGFREPFPFTFSPEGEIYGSDNTTVSCEEINLINSGEYYGWPEMGTFPFADCAAAPGTQPLFNLARDELLPGDFLAYAEVSGLAFLVDSPYASLTDGLLVCESHKSIQDSDGILRRIVIEGGTVGANDVVASSCGGEVAVGPDGSVYYATITELRKLVDSDEPPAATDQAAPSVQ